MFSNRKLCEFRVCSFYLDGELVCESLMIFLISENQIGDL